MQTTVFIAPLPLRRHVSPGRKLQFSARTTHPTAVAKPPPRTPKADSFPKSNQRKKRKKRERRENTTRSRPPSRPTDELTAAQLSEKLARAFGLDLILSDVTSLTKFFQSLVKPKPSNRTKQHPSNDPDSELESQTSLTIPTYPQSYQPKSATAANIARAYTTTRGALERAIQTLSIHTRTYVNTATHVAGDTVCKILSVGHEAFPSLKLDRAKDAVKGVLKDGWTPLNVFQWQLSAEPGESLEQRRQVRIQQISEFFRGGGMSDFVSATGSAFTGVGKTAEKLAPMMFKGVNKTAVGNVERARKLSNPPLGSKPVIRKQQKQKTRRGQGKYPQYLPKRTSIDVLANIAAKSLSKPQVPRLRVSSATKPAVASVAVSSVASKTHEVRAADELQDRAEYDISASVTNASQGSDVSKAVPKENNEFIRNGAIVLAAGAVATVAASASVPAAITCSTLMVASMAFSGAKTANASELQIHARHRARQSRSVQNLEAFVKSPMANVETKAPRALLAPAVQKIRKAKDPVVNTTNPLPTSTKAEEKASVGTIDASAYAVSASQPSIMSMPIIGFLLNWLDVLAYRVEGLIGTILRRSGLRHAAGINKEEAGAGWELLRSFQRNSHPD